MQVMCEHMTRTFTMVLWYMSILLRAAKNVANILDKFVIS